MRYDDYDEDEDYKAQRRKEASAYVEKRKNISNIMKYDNKNSNLFYI